MFNQKEYIKEWRKNNKDKIIKQKKKDYQKNKEKIKKDSLKYYYKNKEDLIKKGLEYCKKNKEKINKKRREDYNENKRNTKEKSKIRNNLYYSKNKNNKEFVKIMIIKRMSRKRYSKRKKECSFCGMNKRLELHHYTQPITVDEVLCSCVGCHSLVHSGETMEKINIPV